MSTGPEKRVEDTLLLYLTNIGGYAIKNQASPTTGKGRPDISACLQGYYLAIEVKHGKGTSRTTLSQYNHLIRIARAGGFAYYVNNADDFEKNIKIMLKKSNSSWTKLRLNKSSPRTLLTNINQILHTYTIVRITKNGDLLVLK